MTVTVLGALSALRRARTSAISRSGSIDPASAGTTNAWIASPLHGSGAPTTYAWATCGSAASTRSIAPA
jgi:hypothetical protein